MDPELNPEPSRILSLLYFGVSAGGMFFTGTLMYQHWWLLRHNMTSIEYLSNNNYWCRAHHLEVKVPMTHAFDFGLWRNLQEGLGSDYYFWFLPTSPNLNSDGYRWETNPDRVKEIQDG